MSHRVFCDNCDKHIPRAECGSMYFGIPIGLRSDHTKFLVHVQVHLNGSSKIADLCEECRKNIISEMVRP